MTLIDLAVDREKRTARERDRARGRVDAGNGLVTVPKRADLVPLIEVCDYLGDLSMCGKRGMAAR